MLAAVDLPDDSAAVVIVVAGTTIALDSVVYGDGPFDGLAASFIDAGTALLDPNFDGAAAERSLNRLVNDFGGIDDDSFDYVPRAPSPGAAATASPIASHAGADRSERRLGGG